MSQSGGAAQVISLPKGGGALQGIGETFAPDLHTGTGNFTVPIALPPGRNGFQPQINLVYSTGNSNGPFGLGWMLSVPGVTRKTSKGVPRYRDESEHPEEWDTFVLSGAEDLVPVPGGPLGAQRYRPRTEGLFAHIDRHHRSDGDSHWKVHSKDGLVSVYGTPRPLNAAADWRDPASVADPARPTHIFAWKLTRTSDPFGNRIEYQYERDAVQTDGPHGWDQVYLSAIRYVDHGDPADPQFLITVEFIYENRPDPFSEYRSGFEIRTVRRCTKIVVSTHAGVETPARTYHLIYLDKRDLPATQLPHNGVSLVSQFIVEGHDGLLSETLPPLEFAYTRFEPDRRDFFPITGPDMPPGSLARPEYELADLTGNGLPDILEMNGTVRYWPNAGDGHYGLPREMRTAPAGLQLAGKGVQLIDADGDGGLDLMVVTEHLAGYYPLLFGGSWDSRSFRPYRQAPSFDLEDPEVRLVDLDGDGVTDAIRSSSRLECFFNDPEKGWHETRRVERRAIEEFPDVTFSDPRVRWADMAGDGLQDILLVYDGNIEYWPSLGRGDWAKRISMRNSPRFPDGYDPKRILVGDVDGDGLADLVYVDDTKVTLWINQSGNQWSDPIEILGTPPVSDMDAVRLADMRGSGISGVLWSMDAGGFSRATMFFLDFTGGIKPYLLNQMDDHMGAISRVEYAPSTRFYLEDEKRPETRWKTPLPLPVQVVARVEIVDSISGGKTTTEYAYHHGYWDGAEREFRGFGRVDQRDTEVFEDFHAAGLHPADRPFEAVPVHAFSPPTETRTWFHQGPIGDEFGDWTETDYSGEFWPGDPQVLMRPETMVDFLNALPRRVKRDALRTLRGQVRRTELYALDGTDRQERPYTVTEHLAGVREEAAPTSAEGDRQHIFFAHAIGGRTTQWERGNDPMTQFAFTGDHDKYGQPQSQISIAVPRGRNFLVAVAPGDPYLATHTRTVYAQRDDDQRYIVNRPARVTTHEILNDGSAPLFTLRGAIEQQQTAAPRLIGQSITFYDGPAFQGLPFAQVGDYGAPTRTESLVLTPQILEEAYKNGADVVSLADLPPYLSTSGPPAWTPEYPPEFRDLLPPLAGYIFQAGGAGSVYESGYFAAAERRRYDFHDDVNGRGRGLVIVKRDPLAHDTTVAYDAFALLPTEVVDAAGLVMKATYDPRVLQPREVTDSNGNRTVCTFSPLGLVQSTAVIGKSSKSEGDTLAQPSLRFVHDLLGFVDAGRPTSVRTIKRVHHVHDTDVPLPERDETVEMVEYSDGFSRLLQTRTQAEDVIFGDPHFGGGVLGADQSIPTGGASGTQLPPGSEARVVVSGWQVYDNKGRVVQKYEPFFAIGWDYADPIADQLGERATIFYDPLGRAIRTVNTDGSEQRAILGVPADLSHPEQFSPTAWESYSYDPNDNGGRTHPDQSLSYQDHWNTPSSATVDALGRTVRKVVRNGPNPLTDWHTTRSTYDIQGNLITVIDVLGRLAFRYVYDLAKRTWRSEQVDAGVRRVVVNAAGNPLEQRDSKASLTLHSYDVLNRPIRLWTRDDATQPLTLRGRTIYGDTPDATVTQAQAVDANLLGRIHRHYDEAGRAMVEAYDFKGNVAEKVRHVIADAAILAVFSPPPPGWDVQAFRVDWQSPAGVVFEDHADGLLDPVEWRVSLTYDGLSRVKAIRYPKDVLGERKEVRPHYSRAGGLERVDLDGAAFVEQIAFNAKGQRSFVAYGNGLMIRYGYEPATFRLARLRTERYDRPTPLTYESAGATLQDFAYAYDLAGNVVTILDRTSGSGVLGNPDALAVSDPVLAQLLVVGDALVRRFEYDPLYHLRSATGRECEDIPKPRRWADDPHCGFNSGNHGAPDQDNAPALTAIYREDYTYDPAGNMTRLKHNTNGASWTRHFGMGGLTPHEWNEQWPNHATSTSVWLNPPGNRLTHVGDATSSFPQSHFFDPAGNLVRETTSRHFEWDHGDRLRVYRTQTGASEPSVHAHYLYDGSGQRVKKVVRKQGGGVDVTIYIDGVFEHYRSIGLSSTHEHDTLHVMDNQARIALVRIGPPAPEDTTPAVKFIFGDHLGTSNVVVDGSGTWINREEYTPYGEASMGSFSRKRYRFTGKERDGESGLYYHGMRYYAPWLARWTSCDPAGLTSGPHVYLYTANNPLNFTDPTGAQQSSAPGREGQTPGQDPSPPPPPATGAEIAGRIAKAYVFSITFPLMIPVYAATAVAKAPGAILEAAGAPPVTVGAVNFMINMAMLEIAILPSGAAGMEGAIDFVAGKGGAKSPPPSSGASPPMAPKSPAIIRGGADETTAEHVAAMHERTEHMAGLHGQTAQPIVELSPGSLKGIDDATLWAHGVSARKGEAASWVNIGGKDLTPAEFAMALKDAGWEGGTLRLGACGTGAPSPLLNQPFNQALSRQLGFLKSPTAVSAPIGEVWGQGGRDLETIVGVPMVVDPATKVFLPKGQGWSIYLGVEGQ